MYKAIPPADCVCLRIIFVGSGNALMSLDPERLVSLIELQHILMYPFHPGVEGNMLFTNRLLIDCSLLVFLSVCGVCPLLLSVHIPFGSIGYEGSVMCNYRGLRFRCRVVGSGHRLGCGALALRPQCCVLSLSS
jgi:hypothetical protein